MSLRTVLAAVSARWDAYWRRALHLVDGGSEAEAVRARRLVLKREADIMIRFAKRTLPAPSPEGDR